MGSPSGQSGRILNKNKKIKINKEIKKNGKCLLENKTGIKDHNFVKILLSEKYPLSEISL
jgi:hypothetical protein